MHERSEADAFFDSRCWERGRPRPHSARKRARALPYGRGTAPLGHVRDLRSIFSREAFAFSMIVAQIESPIQQTIQVDFLVNHLVGRGGLAFMNEVAPAKVFRCQTDSL